MKTLEKNKKKRGKIKNGILTILLIPHLINALEYKTYYRKIKPIYLQSYKYLSL